MNKNARGGLMKTGWIMFGITILSWGESIYTLLSYESLWTCVVVLTASIYCTLLYLTFLILKIRNDILREKG